MTRPTKPVPAPAGASKPWQMFPPVLTTSRRSPFDLPRHAPSPQPPAMRDEPASGDPSPNEPGSERPAMSAPAAKGSARDA